MDMLDTDQYVLQAYGAQVYVHAYLLHAGLALHAGNNPIQSIRGKTGLNPPQSNMHILCLFHVYM